MGTPETAAEEIAMILMDADCRIYMDDTDGRFYVTDLPRIQRLGLDESECTDVEIIFD